MDGYEIARERIASEAVEQTSKLEVCTARVSDSIKTSSAVVLGALLSGAIACGAMHSQAPRPPQVQTHPHAVTAEPVPVPSGPHVSLPTAQHVAPLRPDRPVVTVSTEEVLLDGQRVADVHVLAAKTRVERIETLIAPLEALKRDAGDAFAGSVLLRADERVACDVILEVLFSLAQAGYARVDFAVASGSTGEARLKIADRPYEDPRLELLNEITLALLVQRDGYVLATSAGERETIPMTSGAFDREALGRALVERRKLEPTRRRIVLVLVPDIAYGAAIAALDTLLAHGFDDVSLASGEAPRGSLSKEDIRRVISANIHRVRACYERAMDASGTEFDGRVAVRFVIAADGTISESKAVSNTTGSDAVAACIVAEVRGWTFPKPEGGGFVVVTYPFVLQMTQVEGAEEGG